MASTLGANDVDRIATLARLALTSEERARFAAQLSDVLEYVAQISTIDTTGVAATSHPLWADNAWRDDQPEPSLPTSDVLANAPEVNREAGLFRVPKVIGG
ncbi:MAG: Asp-tRNA(Asn)/Glu-tRNA(Gln) amidotransferase subunit GatC [Vicinamibacterales bacterium]